MVGKANFYKNLEGFLHLIGIKLKVVGWMSSIYVRLSIIAMFFDLRKDEKYDTVGKFIQH